MGDGKCADGGVQLRDVRLLRVFGTPNNWSLDSSGTLTKDMETEQFKATVGWMRDTWSAGLWWPDSPASTDSRSNFVAGKFVVGVEGFGNSWNDFWRRGLQASPPRHFGFVNPFRSEAGALSHKPS